MSFQASEITLTNGQQTGSVVFPAAFAGTPTPPLVVPVIQNFIDGSILALFAEVTSVSASGFTFKLTAPTDSGNYRLVYMAGSSDMLFAAITVNGQRLTQNTTFNGTLQDNDRIPFVSMNPIPKSFALTIQALRNAFLSKLASAPSGPGAVGGSVSAIIATDDYLFVRTPSGYGRIGLSRVQWDLTDKARKYEEGSHQCTTALVQTITFGATFPVIPRVRLTFRNEASGDKLALYGTVTARSTTTCTVTLNAVPSNGTDYYIDYEATSPQA